MSSRRPVDKASIAGHASWAARLKKGLQKDVAAPPEAADRHWAWNRGGRGWHWKAPASAPMAGALSLNKTEIAKLIAENEKLKKEKKAGAWKDASAAAAADDTDSEEAGDDVRMDAADMHSKEDVAKKRKLLESLRSLLAGDDSETSIALLKEHEA